jgi:hypothetical protein
MEVSMWSYLFYFCPLQNLFLCARQKFGFNKKIRRNLLIVYVYYQPNSCTPPTELDGLEESF